MNFGLAGKIAVVTGAASGMGLAIAGSFLEHGTRVLAVDRDADGLAALAAARPGDTLATLQADLSVRAEVEAIVGVAADRFGTVDILVNNAGIMDNFQGVDDLDDAIWDRCMAVNADAPMRLMRAASRIMLAKGAGAIINISSLSGLSGASAGAAYTASKSALMGLTRAAAWAYAERGVRCNAILPGATATNIGKSIGADISQAGFERSSRFHALSPVSMSPQDIADIVLFLASDRAVRINGAEICADGGWSAT